MPKEANLRVSLRYLTSEYYHIRIIFQGLNSSFRCVLPLFSREKQDRVLLLLPTEKTLPNSQSCVFEHTF